LLNSSQIAQYSDILSPLESITDYSDNAMQMDCAQRRTDTCSSFTYDNGGFSAKITLPHQNLVFFSVPYDSGWLAAVNGKPAKIEEVNIGFMAVLCPAGTSSIRFNYTTPGLHTGILVTAVSAVIFALYIIMIRRKKRKTQISTNIEISAVSKPNLITDSEDSSSENM
jgi:uncharacterized membrane protein YfhO